MRLIDTQSLRVITKRDDEIPTYAILSHTWGRDDEEVTLQDMKFIEVAIEADPAASSTHPLVQRPGYTKIKESASIAFSEGLNFI